MKYLFQLLVLVCLLFQCARQETPPPLPNILWISCEDISPAWSCYGDEQASTPNIDALATARYIFKKAYSNAPICSPARSTLITGLYAKSLGTQNLRSEVPLPAHLKTLPELMKQAGYYTSNNFKTDYNFMPQKPYIQNAVIFNKGKRSYEELFRVKALGQLSEESQALFEAKAIEEIYDLEVDPFELNNLIADEKHQSLVEKLRQVLKKHMIEHKDTGLMNEGDMMQRAQGSTVFEMAGDPQKFDPAAIFEVADLVGRVQDLNELKPHLKDEDPAKRFWALMAIDAYTEDISTVEEELKMLLEDTSLPNRTLAAEILINKLDKQEALNSLAEALKTENEIDLLQAAICLRNIGAKAKPILPLIEQEIYPKIAGKVWGRYKTWSYPMFIGMALDQSMMNCGKEIDIKN